MFNVLISKTYTLSKKQHIKYGEIELKCSTFTNKNIAYYNKNNFFPLFNYYVDIFSSIL